MRTQDHYCHADIANLRRIGGYVRFGEAAVARCEAGGRGSRREGRRSGFGAGSARAYHDGRRAEFYD
ncbi:MAG: hypothetical protein U0800_13195 [Isosphaeraceae bacterium]